MPPVGDGSCQIGNLQRSRGNFTLTDGCRYNCAGIPALAVNLVVNLTIGNVPPLLSRQIDTQLIPVTHGNHVVLPNLESLLNTGITLAAVQHIVQTPAKIGVARGSQGRHQVKRRSVTVTSGLAPPQRISVVTGVHGLRRYDTLLQENKSLYRFKGRTRRVVGHDRAIKQRFVGILLQQLMILSAHTPHQHGGIERRSRHHGQYLARFGLNHHNPAQLVLHQLFAVGL